MASDGNDKNQKNLLAWFLGIDPKFDVVLSAALPNCKIEKKALDLEKIITDEQSDIPSIIFCGKAPEGVSLLETAQTLRSVFSDTPTYLVMDARDLADRPKLVKNGFNDVFFLPLDTQIVQDSIAKIYSNLAGAQKRYRAVKLMDLKADTSLDFDTFIYLPMNNKHVRISGAKDKLRDSQIQKMKNSNMNSLFIAEEEMGKFYSYAATALRDLQGNPGMSETEKQERLRNSVRDIMSGFFTDESSGIESGKRVAEDCRKIVQQYMSADKMGDIYDKLLKISTGAGDSYSHSMNVSAYAGLFGMALGLPSVEELALAGLLHDIGMAKVPMEIQNKDPKNWTEEEKKIYQSHSDFSIDMIKERKIVVKDTVFKMIAQHHEKPDGSGYPKGPNCGKILLEAQVLALADEFDEMLTVKPGKPSKTPREVVQYFHQMATSDPAKAIMEPAMLKKILDIFPPPAAEAAA